MVGGNALSDLRGKSTSCPFDKIIELEKIVEENFLEEQRLAKQLKEIENKIRDLTQNNDNNSDVLSPETIDAIDGFKAEMMSTRSQLRSVKFDLRRDVENLKRWVIAINVAILPIIFAGLALIISLRRKNYSTKINFGKKMTKKRFLNISITTAALIVLAIISINLNTSNYGFENRGKLLLDNFTKTLMKLQQYQLIF